MKSGVAFLFVSRMREIEIVVHAVMFNNIIRVVLRSFLKLCVFRHYLKLIDVEVIKIKRFIYVDVRYIKMIIVGIVGIRGFEQ